MYGPDAMRASREEYNEAVQVSERRELLLNLVRLRYDETPYFLQISSITTTFSAGASLGASGTFPQTAASDEIYGLNSGLSYSESPSVTWAIPDSREFLGRFYAPVGANQLTLLAQSGFDPLSRTCRFMLTEEAHHMFVGETGVGRTIQRTCEAMKEAGIEDAHDVAAVRALGIIDLPTIQKKLNLHYTLSLDLFGQEVSTNAANAFNGSAWSCRTA